MFDTINMADCLTKCWFIKREDMAPLSTKCTAKQAKTYQMLSPVSIANSELKVHQIYILWPQALILFLFPFPPPFVFLSFFPILFMFFLFYLETDDGTDQDKEKDLLAKKIDEAFGPKERELFLSQMYVSTSLLIYAIFSFFFRENMVIFSHWNLV